MLRDRDQASLLDVVLAAEDIQAFTKGYSQLAFLDDPKTQASVLHRLILIGEGVRRLSAAFKDAHPVVPWQQIAGTRNRVIHEYERVNLKEVWNMVQRDIPDLIGALRPFLPERQGGTGRSQEE
jgi:uncharacterized protein with HEPN domain